MILPLTRLWLVKTTLKCLVLCNFTLSISYDLRHKLIRWSRGLNKDSRCPSLLLSVQSCLLVLSGYIVVLDIDNLVTLDITWGFLVDVYHVLESFLTINITFALLLEWLWLLTQPSLFLRIRAISCIANNIKVWPVIHLLPRHLIYAMETNDPCGRQRVVCISILLHI